MDLEYDHKFDEMKKYIPFLENMISRLESTSTSPTNPRQAQLDKIRSLRDLLLDKKKRMKMENLQKCEQVLINLYAKVEQRDTLPGIKKPSDPLFQSGTVSEKLDLDVCRSKLKIVASQINPRKEETLPEIARASETDIDCIPGSKEPALFHRRPNKASLSPTRKSLSSDILDSKSPTKSVPKRNYTRVLISPERSPRTWTQKQESSIEKPLFSRRSPRKSPRKSPSHKKDKKKSSKQKKTHCKDLNITLNVPEESLSSLNRRDILSRIIECPNDDVDIKTLCDVKAQILRELKQSGSSEDISDLILKSYRVKKKPKKKEDVEEGELSDSESEAIESIYGSLVIVDKDIPGHSNRTSYNEKSQRKVQICLVLNSDKPNISTDKGKESLNDTDTNDFQMFDDHKNTSLNECSSKQSSDKDNTSVTVSVDKPTSQDVITIDDDDAVTSRESLLKVDNKSSQNNDIVSSNTNQEDKPPTDSQFKANFYKPMDDQKEPEKDSSKLKDLESKKSDNSIITGENVPSAAKTPTQNVDGSQSNLAEIGLLRTHEANEEIPLLNTEPVVPAPPSEKDVLSEIDILQALKNEILSGSIAIPGGVSTPPLHQPKITKVASAQEIITKKKISLEKYKEKSGSTKTSLFLKDPSTPKVYDQSKKQSLKLTDEELERFKFPPKLALEDSSDEEAEKYSADDVYGDLDEDLAPKSPDNNEQTNFGSSTPVIIPQDPIKHVTVSCNSDIDMRKLMPILSPNSPKPVPPPNIVPCTEPVGEQKQELKRSILTDPRVARELNKPLSKESPKSRCKSQEGTMLTHTSAPNMTPSMTSRSFEMTPSRQTFQLTPSRQIYDLDDNSRRKHVYAPLPTVDDFQREQIQRQDYWETNEDRDLRKDTDLRDRGSQNKWSVNDKYNINQRDDRKSDCPRTPIPSFGRQDTVPPTSFGQQPMNLFGRSDCPTTPVHPFGRSDCPSTPSHSFGRSECPSTPIHPFGRSNRSPTPSRHFGRSECPLTPSHPFGRSDAPIAPNHPFGWSEMPLTPSHMFGRNDAPVTPNHPFGRSDMPMTPSHPFGRQDAPRTPSHPFGQPDYSQSSSRKDPRLSRNAEYSDDRNRGYQKGRRTSGYSNRSYDYTESYRNFDREYSRGSGDRNKHERQGRVDHRDRTPSRDSSTGHGNLVTYDAEKLYTRDRGKSRSNNYQRDYEHNINYNAQNTRQDNHRDTSVGRPGPTDERFARSSSRAPSLSRSLQDVSPTKTLSVKPQSGRSFTIDTSVNSTFQEFLTGKGLQVLEQRRDPRSRAASVGRSLTREPSLSRPQFRESSVGRTLLHSSQMIHEDTSGYKRMVNFVRARSMGRDRADERSFKDIKADFESYKVPNVQTKPVKPENKVSRDSRCKKDMHHSKKVHSSTTKPVYSPRKNYRDPRMRKELNKGNEKFKSESKRKGYGIVYSSDNIAKGTILGPGYGVKNYKIPKIKRPIDEKPVTENVETKKEQTKDLNTAKHIATEKVHKKIDEKVSDKSIKSVSLKKSKDLDTNKIQKDKQVLNDSKINASAEEKRITRSKKCETEKKKEAVKEITPRTRKFKKAIIDSDSEFEVDTKQNEKADTLSSNVKESGNIDDISLNTSFGIDDLEIFTDNMSSDPVLANINALIADLDNDLDANKTDAIDFTEDNISFDTMLDKIDEPSVDKQLTAGESLDDISELIKKDMEKAQVETSATPESGVQDSVVNSVRQPVQQVLGNTKAESKQENPGTMTQELTEEQQGSKVGSEAIVSTTEDEKETEKSVDEICEDRSSTPDSTINNEFPTNKFVEKSGLPDSTNEKSEMNSDVTSTHDLPEASSSKDADNPTRSDIVPLESIGSFLSMLKDKSKIQELLGMLGDKSSENERIKKTLEKISEIVSNQDNTNTEADAEPTSAPDLSQKDVDSALLNDNIVPADVITSKDAGLFDKLTVETTKSIENLPSTSDETNKGVTVEGPKRNSSVKKPSIKLKKKNPAKKNKKGKGKMLNKTGPDKEKRVTRSGASNISTEKPKKASRELRQLHESIKEMFISDDILNATGIRLCRLAKINSDKNLSQDVGPGPIAEPKPVVILEKFKDNLQTAASEVPKTRKKPGPKPKVKSIESSESQETKSVEIKKPRPGPKSKTKAIPEETDPYSFEDSTSETMQSSVHDSSVTDSDDESLTSSKSYGSSEVLADFKKKTKRKRRPGWQSGIIKKRKKTDTKVDMPPEDPIVTTPKEVSYPDMSCFTDKTYCFQKNISTYSCRLCDHTSKEIVNHYKTQHPHTEIPLSRMSEAAAKEAIAQCEDINFQAMSKMLTDKYICRFCFEEFRGKKNNVEEFFWHVVSAHTGEYKHLCSECINVTKCPFNLDIPPPPKEIRAQLIGYVCGKCNFSQISLENLKTHVIVRHNDEKTEVYTVNLSVINKKEIKKQCHVTEKAEARVLRSSRMQASSSERSDHSDGSERLDGNESLEVVEPKIPVHSKLTFESDDLVAESLTDTSAIKIEKEDAAYEEQSNEQRESEFGELEKNVPHQPSPDIMDCPHFKVTYETGTKEYACCIKGDYHYKTSLLISMKKHVQLKHKEIWDGYCFICKVIVTSQGSHSFKECLEHCLDKHIDDFPVLEGAVSRETNNTIEQVAEQISEKYEANTAVVGEKFSALNYINVRPMADLLSKERSSEKVSETILPIIESVVSLGAVTEELSQPPRTNSPQLEPPSDTASIYKCPSPATQPSPAPVTQRSPAPVTQPPPAIVTQPSPAIVTQPSPAIVTQPSPAIVTQPSPAIVTQPSPAIVAQPSPLPAAQPCSSLAAQPCPSPEAQSIPKPQEAYKYEEVQAEVMAKKHRVILDSMLSHDKLVHIYKCAGAYCAYSTNSAEAAILHASAHQRFGGVNSLMCAYCDYDCQENAINLVTHVFKTHGSCQYVCSYCFYRAIASQLVFVHIAKFHPESQKTVLHTKTVSPIAEDLSENILPREIAVQPYVCTDLEKQCRFKTYIHEKFISHLASHNASYFLCHVCLAASQTIEELIEHLKCHGYRLYQCTWCIDGGDNESEFLVHTSAKHPSKEPQAYLRLTRNNKILPLAKFSCKAINTVQVIPTEIAGDPAKIAQNSLDLEKIITWTALSTNDTSKIATQSKVVETDQPDPETLSVPEVTSQQLAECTLLSTPSNQQTASSCLTPVLKEEPPDDTPTKDNLKPDVICLDSDEETPQEPKQHVIDLSDDDRSSGSTPKKPLDFYQCSNCYVKFKISPGFKKHILVCFLGMTKMNCAHCGFFTDNVHSLYTHYSSSHKGQHSKNEHGVVQSAITTKAQMSERLQSATHQAKGVSTQRPKRKLSGNSSETLPDNSPKRQRFGPQDLDKLPQKPILDTLTYCSECEFSTKVRLNLVRHFQQHAEALMVPQTAPVNPVPHLETNEKHFDKMINLASSSLETARLDKQAEKQVVVYIPPEAASRYPKYVPDRQRYTCGAKDCSYISLDESMLKHHWEALHTGSNDFHCVHCPPYQHLDKSKPLTSSRIITHLKMHDTSLYACSSCPYYHFKKPVLEKHITEVHKGSSQMLVVREESISQAASSQSANAPTMDLKPWKCGLCPFKNMLLPEVVEHCSRMHNTKMQFKCPACPFRTSTLENVTKHKSKSHPSNNEDVFYYYYREGSIPDEPDGTPRWVKQSQMMGNPEPTPEVKTESVVSSNSMATLTPIRLAPPDGINLGIVKKEVVDPEETMEELCKHFGDICDPNGLKFVCPLCKFLMAESKEDMQSHLYEELQYRKWGCNFCSYKGFHKVGLKDHIFVEHKQTRAMEPKELPVDTRVERWVAKVLEHQSSLIEAHKADLAQQKTQVERPTASPSTSKDQEKPPKNTEKSDKILENLIDCFGDFGSPNDMNFCCPKCDYQTPNEGFMRDHLESELNKIRWRCSACNKHSTNYHEAQLHCKVCSCRKAGKNPQPAPTARDPLVRTSWIAEVIGSQSKAMDKDLKPMQVENAVGGALENSLLVERYAERIPTPEEEMWSRRKRPAPSLAAAAMSAAPAVSSPDSDDERLVIDEHNESDKKVDRKQCPYCEFHSKYQAAVDWHILRHYNLKPYTCGYCDKSFHKVTLENHLMSCHPDQPERYHRTKLPSGPPLIIEFPKKKSGRLPSRDDVPSTSKPEPKGEEKRVICLVCEKNVTDTARHTHDRPTYFAAKGDVIVKCCTCLALLPSEHVLKEHHNQLHPNTQLNYAYYKLHHDKREIHYCGYCNKRFKFIRDLKTHHSVYHSSLHFKYESKAYVPGAYDAEIEDRGESIMKDSDVMLIEPVAAKRVARKSTTKLPSQSVARKSTTKLPFGPSFESDKEYSFYGTEPVPMDDIENITTSMSLGNAMVPVTLKNLRNVMKIEPLVIVKDCKK